MAEILPEILVRGRWGHILSAADARVAHVRDAIVGQ
jgi:hypothetical protein